MHLKRTLPDLIVSDLNMPHMSGYELLSVIRRRFLQIVTVAMSGDYPGDGLPTGVIADAFFAKGQSPRNLLASIAALIFRSESWVCTHQADAPAWIPRPGMTLMERRSSRVHRMLTELSVFDRGRNHWEDTGDTMPFCPSKNRYIIESIRQTHAADACVIKRLGVQLRTRSMVDTMEID